MPCYNINRPKTRARDAISMLDTVSGVAVEVVVLDDPATDKVCCAPPL